MITIICLVFLIVSVLFDFLIIKIPNSIVLIAGLLLLLVNYFLHGINIWPQSVGCFALIIITLFPLFALNLLGGGDIKILAVLAVAYGYKRTMIIFCFSVAWGALIGIVKIIKYGGLGERLQYFKNYLNQIMTNLWMQGGENKQRSYINGLAEEEVKKYGIHFSLPILLGFLAFIFWGIQ